MAKRQKPVRRLLDLVTKAPVLTRPCQLQLSWLPGVKSEWDVYQLVWESVVRTSGNHVGTSRTWLPSTSGI